MKGNEGDNVFARSAQQREYTLFRPRRYVQLYRVLVYSSRAIEKPSGQFAHVCSVQRIIKVETLSETAE